MSETNVVKDIILACSRGASRLFKLNTGVGWVGNFKRVKAMLVATSFRPLRAGLILANGDVLEGASDLNGWTSKVITPDMVGLNVAIYTVIEVKDLKGRTADHQKKFIANVRAAGGIAGVAKTPEQAQAIIDAWPYNE